MAKHANHGDRVRVLFLTDGEAARGPETADAGRRQAACNSAVALLGAEPPAYLDFPDNAMDRSPLIEIVKRIEAEIGAFIPDVVYTHHAHDLNIDHRITHEAVMTVYRPQPARPCPTILAFEVMSSTEWRAPTAATVFIPNWYEDISVFLVAKKAALMAYRDEMRPWPHSRSIEAVEHLARWRGACVGVEAAEAFSLVRKRG